jgi:glucose/arabinose dehydrogenase
MKAQPSSCLPERTHLNTNRVLWLIASFLFLILLPVYPQGSKALVEASKQSNIHRPKQVDATEERLKTLKLPEGFTITKFAEGMKFPRFMVVGKDSSVYITDRDSYTLTRIKDTDHDGKADRVQILLHKMNIHGIELVKNRLYLVTCRELLTVELKKDGTIDSNQVKILISDLPDCGQHKNRTVRMGPDSMLYISVGSTCNSCDESNKENATMLVCTPDGKKRRVFATGLRNTIGFDWHPTAKTMWGFDHGMDELGDDVQKEELNKIVDGANYGWPYIIEDGKFDIHHDPKGGVTHEEYAKKCTSPVLMQTAHSSPMDFRFYRGSQFPEKYHNGAFAAMRGSWNRSTPSGYLLLYITFDKKGEAVAKEEFLTGFITDHGKEQFGRPVGITTYPDGSLLFSDDSGGTIYRVAYQAGSK